MLPIYTWLGHLSIDLFCCASQRNLNVLRIWIVVRRKPILNRLATSDFPPSSIHLVGCLPKVCLRFCCLIGFGYYYGAALLLLLIALSQTVNTNRSARCIHFSSGVTLTTLMFRAQSNHFYFYSLPHCQSISSESYKLTGRRAETS